jgi:hypothetical protein
VIPDAVVWRFGWGDEPVSQSRFLGGIRNTLQRLWWRVRTLRDPEADDELWLLDTENRGLTEDNLVAITERSHTAAYREFSKTIARQFVLYREFIDENTTGSAEDLMRDTMKRVVRVAAFANFGSIPEHRQMELIRELFAETIEAMEGYAPPPGEVYESLAVRDLKPIDLPGSSSNQHEIQGVTALRNLLGAEDRELECDWTLYWDNGSVRDESSSTLKWYDARESSPSRSEWRLYYPGGTPMEQSREGDMLILATNRQDDRLRAFILPRESDIYMRAREILESQDGTGADPQISADIWRLLHRDS